jgi:hypothetical protein
MKICPLPREEASGRDGSSRMLMGLDVYNGLFGNFHLNWSATGWFGKWCSDHGMPYPFICWKSGFNDGDRCDFRDARAVQLAKDWCDALERNSPELAKLGKSLLENPPVDFGSYLYPHRNNAAGKPLAADEWERRAVASWYAILRYGSECGDILEYW